MIYVYSIYYNNYLSHNLILKIYYICNIIVLIYYGIYIYAYMHIYICIYAGNAQFIIIFKYCRIGIYIIFFKLKIKMVDFD